jgi:hypothetical protein
LIANVTSQTQQAICCVTQGRDYSYHVQAIAPPLIDLVNCGWKIVFASQNGTAKLQDNYL